MAQSMKTEAEKREKGRALARTPGERLAYGISLLTSPFLLAVPLFGFVALSTAPTLPTGLWWWVIICLGLAVPFLDIWLGVKQGRYTDMHISVRSQRLVPMMLGLGCIGGIFGCLLVLHASRALLATLTATLISFLVATLITQLAKYKISFHIGALTGTLTVCCLLVSPLFLLLSPLVLLVGWARWKVEAHTALQAVCGAALALCLTVGSFWLFGLR